MKKPLFIILILLGSLDLLAQYPPPAGQEGTTALHADTSLFVDWAITCEVNRGYLDISIPDSGFASAGESVFATGKADNTIVSLGDRGSAVLTFNLPVSNGPGPDFAIFENGFTDQFLELAFVEVSSNGIDFVRFPSISLTQTISQIEPYGLLDATKLHNLAGKYRAMYGVPFDLDDIEQSTKLNKFAITHVRILSITGSINAAYADYDSQGNIINDPWPTLFPSSGFDLDAVGVINNTSNGSIEYDLNTINIYPNPAGNFLEVQCNLQFTNVDYFLTDISGKILNSGKENAQSKFSIELSNLEPGIYFVKILGKEMAFYQKFIKK